MTRRFSMPEGGGVIPLSGEGVRRGLGTRDVRVMLHESIDSTNAEAARLVRADAEVSGPVLIAARAQTDGRGRLGRSFWSPRDTGLYMTLLLPTDLSPAELPYLTPPAAVAAARAIRDMTGLAVGIKWVNDLYMDGKKVCGILAASAAREGQRFLIVGWGVNLTTRAFPAGLRAPAGCLLDGMAAPGMRDVTGTPDAAPRPDAGLLCGRIAAAFLDLLEREGPRGASVLEEYRAASVLTGRRVVCTWGADTPDGPAAPPVTGVVVGITDDYALLVRRDDGEMMEMGSGEVSVRPASGDP